LLNNFIGSLTIAYPLHKSETFSPIALIPLKIDLKLFIVIAFMLVLPHIMANLEAKKPDASVG
jgi:hypothetical protein